MISRSELKELVMRKPTPGSPVFSVYLNVDQSRAVNLNRGFEAAFKSMIQQTERRLTDESQRKEFIEDAAFATALVADYEPKGKALVLFCDKSEDFCWQTSFGLSIESLVRWAPKPYLRPLVEARDEHQRCAVVLSDRSRGRFFSIHLGDIEEIHATSADRDVRRFEASGSDQMLSQTHFQRKADEHARQHLKQISESVDRLMQQGRHQRLILGGPQEAVSELKLLLGDKARRCLVGAINVPVDASEGQVLEAVVQLQEQVERSGEEKLVEDLLTAAAKNQQAVVGLPGTLKALNEGRVRELVYANGFAVSGRRCPDCSELTSSGEASASVCGGELIEVDDLLEEILEKVVRDGGDVEQLQGEAAERLKRKGSGIGAYLRF